MESDARNRIKLVVHKVIVRRETVDDPAAKGRYDLCLTTDANDETLRLLKQVCNDNDMMNFTGERDGEVRWRPVSCQSVVSDMVVALAALGLGGYLVYKNSNFQNATTVAARAIGQVLKFAAIGVHKKEFCSD